MAIQSSVVPLRLAPDANEGRLANVTITLGAGGSTSTVEIPDWAVGVKLRPGADVFFGVNQNPTKVQSSASAVTVAELGVGGISKANTWEVRLLELKPSRVLHLYAPTGGEVVEVEFF